MQRISVTTLEKFRRYMASTSPFDTEESLMETIRGLFKGNDKTEFGTAYHSAVEGKFQPVPDGSQILYQVNDFMFSLDQIAPALRYREEHPLVVQEMTISKIYQTNYFPIQVSGRIDGIEGCQIRDVKTKFRYPKTDEYVDSYQWRFYLDMMELDTFYYDIFEVEGFDQLPMTKPYFIDVDVTAHPEIPCLRYSNLHRDVMSLLNLFLDYVHNREILHLLKPAITVEEPAFSNI